MKVYLLHSDDFENNEFEEATELLQAHDGPVEFEKCSMAVRFEGQVLSWIRYSRNASVTDRNIIFQMKTTSSC